MVSGAVCAADPEAPANLPERRSHVPSPQRLQDVIVDLPLPRRQLLPPVTHRVTAHDSTRQWCLLPRVNSDSRTASATPGIFFARSRSDQCSWLHGASAAASSCVSPFASRQARMISLPCRMPIAIAMFYCHRYTFFLRRDDCRLIAIAMNGNAPVSLLPGLHAALQLAKPSSATIAETARPTDNPDQYEDSVAAHGVESVVDALHVAISGAAMAEGPAYNECQDPDCEEPALNYSVLCDRHFEIADRRRGDDQ